MGINNIDRAKIKSFITGFLSDPAHDNQSSRSMTAEVFRIALASLEAEPVALRDERSGSGGICKQPCFNGLPHGTPLYAAPPAPVSVPGNSAITQHFDTIALEAAREIMFDVNRRHEFLGGEVQLLSSIQCRIDDAFRAAMLQGSDGNPPMIPDGWVACRDRMPDGMQTVITSNGFDIGQGWWDGEGWNSFDSHDVVPGAVSHWMPLPSPPAK